MKNYSIKEIFYSPQGEGARAGTINVFVRFAGCNLQCTKEVEGFNCDTDFYKGSPMSLGTLISQINATKNGPCQWVILTGGEPSLQADANLVSALHNAGYMVAIETNGTNPLPPSLDYVACSPKPGSPPHPSVRARYLDEIRCVIKHGMEPVHYGLNARNYFVSPACDAPDSKVIKSGLWHARPDDLNRLNMLWAVEWCEKNPKWRISLQMHKILGVR